MSAHNLPFEFLNADFIVTDPGSGGTFDNGQNGNALCKVKTAGAEGRTLLAPLKVGQRALVFVDTYVGACTLTVTGGDGISSVVLGSAGAFVALEAISIAGTAKWTVKAYRGVTSGISRDFATDLLTVNSLKVDPYIRVPVSIPLATGMVNQTALIADRALQLVGAQFSHAVASGGAGKLQLTKDTSTTAPGAGTGLLTNNTNTGFDVNATANTVQTGTLTATTADLQLAAGDRLGIGFSGTVTSLTKVNVTLLFKAL